MSELRLVVVAMSFAGYGGERAAATLAAGLAVEHDVTVLQLGDDPLPPALADGCSGLRLPRRSGLSSAVRTATELARVYDDVRPDGVISIMTYCNLAALAARQRSRSRPPVVATEHSITSELMGVERHAWAMRAACMALYPTALAVVGVSHATVRDLHTFLRPAPLRTHTIFNSCAPSDALVLNAGERGRTVGVADGADVRRVVCVASLKPAKNHELLLNALATMPQDVALDIVGDGPLRGHLEQTARSLGIAQRVVFHGYLPDPSAVIDRADVSVLPSRWEGFGLVAIESAELGVPMVVTPAGALPEVVPRFAPGWVAPASTVVALARTLAHALEQEVSTDEWERARAERRLHLDPELVTREYASLFDARA